MEKDINQTYVATKAVYELLNDLEAAVVDQSFDTVASIKSQLDNSVEFLLSTINFTFDIQTTATALLDQISELENVDSQNIHDIVSLMKKQVFLLSNISPPYKPTFQKKSPLTLNRVKPSQRPRLGFLQQRQRRITLSADSTPVSSTSPTILDPSLFQAHNELLNPLISSVNNTQVTINELSLLQPPLSYLEMKGILNKLYVDTLDVKQHFLSIHALPNIKAAFSRAPGKDVCDVFVSIRADKAARQIMNGAITVEALKSFVNATDLARVAEDQQQVIKRVDLESLAVRKSSTRTRIGAAMTVLTHFLEPHEIENEQMAERMIVYEQLAYDDLIVLVTKIPEMLEDLMFYGSLGNFKDLKPQSKNVQTSLIEAADLIQKSFYFSSGCCWRESEKKRIKHIFNEIQEIIDLAIQQISSVEVTSVDVSPNIGTFSVRELSKALQSNGSQLLSIIWAIVHLPPTDEGKLQFQTEDKANFGSDRGFRAQILLYFEFLSLGITIVTNIKAYYSALQSLEQPKHYLSIPINSKSTKIITNKNKNKIVAGGLCGLLIAARENKLDADTLYHSLSQYGKDIADILPSIPPEYAPAIIQRILATCYADIDQEKVEKFIQSNSTPIYNALRTRLATAKSTLEKQIAKCLTPATDFLIPSEPRSPLFTIAQTDATTIAKQFVKISFNKYNELKIKDFFSNGKAVSIIKQTSFKTCDWVCGLVLSCPDYASRAFMKIQFCSILRELLKLGDFNTAYGVYLGISEIKIDFGKSLVPDQALQSFQKADKLFGANNQHYKLLKSLYKKFDTCIPFIECILDDISRIKNLHPSIYKGKTPDEDNLINFTQNIEIYDEVVNYLQYQNKTYNIATVEPLHSYLTDLPSFNNDIRILLRPYHD
ncbi:Ras guanine nucleotide exchange factor [Entamoeba marina]